jgi:hypothetical protein
MAITNKNVSYVNKTFSDFKTSLQEYAKTYFPTTYNDFSDANPGAMFIEMASYVGDVMSFYLDTQTQENFLLYAKEKENLYALSYALGYRPKTSYASNTNVDVFQLCPTVSGSNPLRPDITNYGVYIPANTVLTSTSTGTKFLTTQEIDFRYTGSTEEYTNIGGTNYFLISKPIPAISAEIKSTTFTFSSPQKFSTVTISDTNILQILNVTDSNSNVWYEVPYLAQSTILNKNSNPASGSDGVSYLASLLNVPRRFTSRVLSDNSLQLEFGSGVSNYNDEYILPTPNNIKSGSISGVSDLYKNYNEASVLFTKEYGLAPSNTTLTVQYLVGGGVESNVPANDLTTIDRTDIIFKGAAPSSSMRDFIKESVISRNPYPSLGGRDGDEVEEIRNNALYAYSSQLRAVTKNDYILRTLSLPSDYGSIAKAYISQDINYNPTQTVSTVAINNPLSLDLYILAYNNNKHLLQANPTLKTNLIKYLNEYRMVTDSINIKDAFYINIGVNFDIIVLSGYSNKDILTSCVSSLIDYFDIDRWSINQPIVLSDLTSRLLQIKGVASVVKLEIINKTDATGVNYSPYGYDIAGATRNGNIYPSIDPAIFEVRYPNTDIQGRVIVS